MSSRGPAAVSRRHDLPEPDSPTRQRISPRPTVNDTLRTAVARSPPAGSAIVTPLTSRIGALDESLIMGAAMLIAGGNQLIEDLPLTADLDFAEAVLHVKAVLQGPLSDDLKSVAEGTLLIADVVNSFSGENLTTQVDAAVLEQVIPPSLSLSNAIVREGHDAVAHGRAGTGGPHEMRRQKRHEATARVILFAASHSEDIVIEAASGDGAETLVGVRLQPGEGVAALAAMQAGKDCYIEKPISHVFNEGPLIIAAAMLLFPLYAHWFY